MTDFIDEKDHLLIITIKSLIIKFYEWLIIVIYWKKIIVDWLIDWLIDRWYFRLIFSVKQLPQSKFVILSVPLELTTSFLRYPHCTYIFIFINSQILIFPYLPDIFFYSFTGKFSRVNNFLFANLVKLNEF